MNDIDLVAKYVPQLMLDRAEPYRPYAYGWTIFRQPGQSPSSRFDVVPAAAFTIEYAIYYDWDIGHLYDLEHIWVHVGPAGQVVKVDASSHGGRKPMDVGAGLPEMNGDHAIIYSEAGKHAHWASPDHMSSADRQRLAALCGPLSGIDGVLVTTPLGEAGAYSASPEDHRLARLRMVQDAFVPSFSFEPLDADPVLLPWVDLEAEIPARIGTALQDLRARQPHFGAIFLDCGDTLIDERSEVKLPGSEVVTSAELIPGAKATVEALKADGHKLILVADGPRKTFTNMLVHHGLWDHFDAHIISEDVGVTKPDAAMFDAALAAAGLTRADAWRTIMVGNNLSRDINGANALGIASVFMAWSTLRTHVPADSTEQPSYRIGQPSELPGLIARLEALLPYRLEAAQSE